LDPNQLAKIRYMTTAGGEPGIEDGRCHICLNSVPLTREHVPPRSAFNDCDLLWERFSRSEVAKDSARYVTLKGGFWVNTICKTCNNGLCSPYANAYVKFVRHLGETPHLCDAGGRQRLVSVPCDTLLLAKEIATMILAVEPVTYANHNAALREFVLDREATFRPNFSVYAFLVPELRQAGTVTRFHGRLDTFAPGYGLMGGEISLFPFGLVYATQIGRGYDLSRLTDITRWFVNGDKRDRVDQSVSLSCRLTGVESIQCGVGRPRRHPQIDYVGSVR
jgi:hypothetical protein